MGHAEQLAWPCSGATAGTTNGDTAIFNRSAPHSPLTIDAGRNLKNITFDTSSVNSLTIGTTGGNALSNGRRNDPNDFNGRELAGNQLSTHFGGRLRCYQRREQQLGNSASWRTDHARRDERHHDAHRQRREYRPNTISGVLADSGSGILAVTKSGAGVWVLSGNNTYTGGTTINDGMLLVTQPGSLPRYATPGQVAVGSFATLTVQAGGVGEWTAVVADLAVE